MHKEFIYNMMNGFYDENVITIPENIVAEDEFTEGKKCCELYEKIYKARLRLGDKLGNDEDRDLEEIIDNMNAITKILCMRMYDYGCRYGQNR